MTEQNLATLSSTNNGPLAGIRVIDMATVVMGPYAAQVLGDLGADVIKIESPNDTIRAGLFANTPGMSALHLNVNRNKRSVALNLKSEEGHAAAMKLIGSADILISNMRIDALRRLGMDYETLSAKFPQLIYVHAQGFRPDSDRAGLAAYDETVQAASGLLDIAQRAADIQKPAVLPTILADKVSALTMVYSAMAALVHQQKTGQGQKVEVPMTDTMLAFNLVEHLQGQAFVPAKSQTGFPNSLMKGHYARPTKDGGLVMVIPYGPQNFRDLFVAAGRPDLAEDPRVNNEFIDVRADGNELSALLDDVIPLRTTEEWAEICLSKSIPFGPVLRLDEAMDDDYVRDGHLLDVAEHPSEGKIRMIGVPMQFSATPPSIRRHAPLPGADTEEVLAELATKSSADQNTEMAGSLA
ncbi:CaiB/BaiF CoA transferase family protein [Psychromicrobium sp. YIM B11713]|uniref:CaiB/BaiF CoA transferase family protein n=1 Tax=Psychromicrobium sp. YIM B11713 TaxID=3145233 RepID=UPI00374E5C8E